MSTETEKILSDSIVKFGLDNFRLLDVDHKDLDRYKRILDELHLDYDYPTHVDKDRWNIPQEYKNIDIENFLVSQCPKENYDRLEKELELYKKYDMIPVLKTMKYIVDTLRKNQIVWGVGRGSSVASYCLHLLGVHKIDSVKYNIPIEEFFKENTNG
jgi:DNA polymerase III alpha subunit